MEHIDAEQRRRGLHRIAQIVAGGRGGQLDRIARRALRIAEAVRGEHVHRARRDPAGRSKIGQRALGGRGGVRSTRTTGGNDDENRELHAALRPRNHDTACYGAQAMTSDAIAGDDAAQAHRVDVAHLVAALTAELAAGRLTSREATREVIDRMVSVAGLAPAEQAELRELLTDLVTNDPHLVGLIGRI